MKIAIERCRAGVTFFYFFNFILDFWTLWEKARVGCSEKIALKQVYYQGWNRPPAQVGCMRQVLRSGALGRPRGMGWGGRREGGWGRGTHVNPWLIHVNVWQKPLQYCKVISLQLIKTNEKNFFILRCLIAFAITNEDKRKSHTFLRKHLSAGFSADCLPTIPASLASKMLRGPARLSPGSPEGNICF